MGVLIPPNGTSSQNNAVAHPSGAISVDTTAYNIRIHDGVTLGGHIVGSGGTSGGVRQTVLDGDSSSGVPSFLTTGSGLTPAYTATVPLTTSYANGFGTSGASDVISQLVSGGNTAACSANTLNYILQTYASSSTSTWSTTLAPPQYGTAYNKAGNVSLTLNNVSTDDFGNPWTNTGSATFANTTPAIASTYYAVLNGSTQFFSYNGAAFSPSGFGNGGWAMRGWFKSSSLAAANGLMCMLLSGPYGVGVTISTSGKVTLYLSSAAASYDIANATTGTATLVTGTWYFIELTFDAVAGKYFVYVNGVLDQTVSSAVKVCGMTQMYVGDVNVSGSDTRLTGNAQGFEFLPYCQHPAGTTYSVPVSLPNIAAAGYASSWIDTVNYQWKTPSAASVVSGNNPTFTATQTVCVGEATAGVSTISSVISYAFQGQYVQAWQNGLPSTASTMTAADNLGTSLKDVKVELLCLTADNGVYSTVGTIQDAYTAVGSGGFAPCLTYRYRNSSSAVTGGTAAFVTENGSGASVTLTSANWAYRIRVRRAF